MYINKYTHMNVTTANEKRTMNLRARKMGYMRNLWERKGNGKIMSLYNVLKNKNKK